MNYEINNDTQLIMPVGKNSSKIIEVDDEYFIKEKTLNILEHSCEYFGSSLEGRKEGTKKLLGITHKSPIIVEESRKIIFFPTKLLHKMQLLLPFPRIRASQWWSP